MVLLIALGALLAWAAVTVAVDVRRDGYRQTRTDWNRVAEHDPMDAPDVGRLHR